MKVRFYLRMRIIVNNFIKKYEMLHEGDTIVVGVSGGADSVCLLFLLCEIAVEKKNFINIEVVHVNHMIRSTAERDALFVENLCREFSEKFGINIPCRIIKEDVIALSKDRHISVEEAGRLVRYEAMKAVLKNKQGRIAVAHHANDRAETMLFNLFRGTGLRGASGIQPVNDQIIRPLLILSRADIENFLNQNNLKYVTDETNLTDEYTRNKIRHNIIEYAQREICEGAVSNMNNAAEQFQLAEDFIKEYTLKVSLRSIYIKEEGRIVIDINELKKEHDYIIDRVLYEALVYVSEHRKDITHEHIRRMKLILESSGTKEISLPYEVYAKKEYDSLFIINRKYEAKDNTEKYQIDMNVLTSFDRAMIPKDIYTKWFDYDKISSVATVRNRREGDYLVINSSMQTKSLKEYLINEKVPKDERDKFLLLADKDHIMWIIGMRISEYYKVTEDTKRVLEVRYIE